MTNSTTTKTTRADQALPTEPTEASTDESATALAGGRTADFEDDTPGICITQLLRQWMAEDDPALAALSPILVVAPTSIERH